MGKIIAIIDPPYGIDVVSATVGGSKPFGSDGAKNVVEANQYSPIIGDDTTETAKKMYEVLKSLSVDKLVIWGGNYFTDFLPPSRCWLVWDKKGREWKDNFSDFEMAWTSFSKPSKIIRHTFMGMVQEGEREKRVHPTQKPITVIVEIIKMFSDEGDIILDLTGGSGSTLIACEQTNRTCFMMEIDCRYIDVIRKRYWKFTHDNNETGWEEATPEIAPQSFDNPSRSQV